MMSNRQARRLMEKMGLNVEEMEGVREVVIQMDDGRSIHIKEPAVYRMKAKDMTVYNVMGKEEESGGPGGEEIALSEDDVKLVMDQTGATRDRAIQALIESGGDLAAAILSIQQSGQ